MFCAICTAKYTRVYHCACCYACIIALQASEYSDTAWHSAKLSTASVEQAVTLLVNSGTATAATHVLRTLQQCSLKLLLLRGEDIISVFMPLACIGNASSSSNSKGEGKLTILEYAQFIVCV
jgi:hypothetical protein